jgi:hypothetical protein
MFTVIVARLKTGTIPDVVPFGTSTLPAPPYVVVKPERDALGRGRAFRIIAHADPDQQTFIQDYIFEELSDLLDGYTAETRLGNQNQVYSEDDFSDLIGNNDDGTISMERVFLVPSRIH